MIYRDDDVSCWTDLTTIISIQKLFDKYKKIHTVTLLMKNLWESRGIWEWLMTTPNLDVALHGWEHIDYSKLNYEEVVAELRKSIEYWDYNVKRMGHKVGTIKVFYAPWNVNTETIRRACDDCGMIFGTETYQDIFNFHWWEFIGGKGLQKLDKVLRGE